MTGDLDDPQSRVSRVVATQKVTTRKPYKGTQPKLFYVGIEGDLLQPSMMRPEHSSMWADHNPLGDGRPATGEPPSMPRPVRRRKSTTSRTRRHGARSRPHICGTKSIAAGVLIIAALLLGTPSGGDRHSRLDADCNLPGGDSPTLPHCNYPARRFERYYKQVSGRAPFTVTFSANVSGGASAR